MPRRYRTADGGGVVFEGEMTGDGRFIDAGALRWENGPWPVQYAPELGWGHDGATLVGSAETFTRNAPGISSEGWIEDAEDTDGATAVAALDAGLPLGVSVDLDDMSVEFLYNPGDNLDDVVVLLAATFPYARIGTSERGSWAWIPGLQGVLASAGIAHLPGISVLTAAAGEDIPASAEVMWTESSDEFVMRVTDARIRGFTLLSMGAFDRAAIELDAAGDAPEAEPIAAASTARPVADSCTCQTHAVSVGHAMAAGIAQGIEDARPQFAGLVASTAMVREPTAAHFTNPSLPFLTPETFMAPDDDGWRRVFGHLAPWNECHTSSPEGECVTAPHSLTGYQFFLTGGMETAEGTVVPVGQLTIGGGHADEHLDFRAAMRHYDDASTAYADVAVGEDQYGIWFAGVLRQSCTDETRRAALASGLSGDWRWIGGGLELIAALGVNAQGFPVPRVSITASGRVRTLIAAGGRTMLELAQATATRPETVGLDPRALSRLRQVEHVLGREDRERLAAIRQELRDEALARLRG